jgi:PAS domain S-box-containing protein
MAADEEARSAAERLARTELELAATQRLAHVGSWQWNVAGNTVAWSDELYRIYGIVPGAFAGTYEAFAARVHPDDLKSTELLLFSVLRDPRPFSYQHRIVRPDGTVRMLDTRGEVVTDDAGNPSGLYGNCWDITEMWLTTQELERSVSLLQATLESTQDGILVVDTDRRVSAYNDRFLKLWRLPRELAEQHDDVALLDAVARQLDDPDEFRRLVERLYRTPSEASRDTVRFADGRIFERYSLPQRVGDDVVGRVWSFRDVTEKEHLLAAETFLADATRLLASLDYESALQAMAQLAVPLLGDACAIDLLAGEGGPRRILSASKAVPESALPELPRAVLSGHRVVDNAGAHGFISVPLSGHEGLLGVLTFVGGKGRRLGQRELSLVAELGQRVALCIDNARLYQHASDALHAREELLSITSHEIRGPLAGQRLAIQALQAGAVPEAARTRLLELVSREGERLNRFIDELADETRIQSGQLHFELSQVDLREVVQHVAARLAPELSRSGSSLTITVGGTVGGSPVGNWDRLRLEQVVTNLLSNAVKFGAGKPISIQVDGGDGMARLVVSDLGVGIPAAGQARLFQPFARAASSRHYGGLGLGLHIVRTIVEGLGGTVRLESAEGKGSRFTVELPTRAAAAGVEEHVR